jgi:osmoprotectant transport system permease protein
MCPAHVQPFDLTAWVRDTADMNSKRPTRAAARRPCGTLVLVALLAVALTGCASDSLMMRGAGGPIEVLQNLWGWFTEAGRWEGNDGIPNRVVEHLYYTGVSLAIALVISLPVGIGLGHLGKGGLFAINLSNIGRAVPEFGIVILVFIIAGYGDLPVIVALVALAMPPIVTNSYVGMRDVDQQVAGAARGMGMTGWQRLSQVELPLALPAIMAGIRTSTVQVIATATIGAYVGLGGLGRYIIDGLAQHRMDQVLGGAVAVAVLAMAAELSLAGLQRLIVPKGIRTMRAKAAP